MVLVSVEEHAHLRVGGGEASPGPRGKTPGRAEIPLKDGRRRRHRAQNSSLARHVRVDGLPLVGPKREQVPNRVVVQVRALEADMEAVELLLAALGLESLQGTAWSACSGDRAGTSTSMGVWSWLPFRSITICA